MVFTDDLPLGRLRSAAFRSVRTAVCEPASLRWIHRRHQFSFHELPFSLFLSGRKLRCCGEQCLGIRVSPVSVNGITGSPLHDFAEIHHNDLITDELDDIQIVGNEQISQFELILQILEKIDDLSLNGHIQGRYRLITNDELRLCRKCPGDADPLSLPTGELMREFLSVLRVQPAQFQQFLHSCLNFLL